MYSVYLLLQHLSVQSKRETNMRDAVEIEDTEVATPAPDVCQDCVCSSQLLSFEQMLQM